MNEWKPIWNSTGGWASSSSRGLQTQIVFLDYLSIRKCAVGAGLDGGQAMREIVNTFRTKHPHIFVYGHTIRLSDSPPDEWQHMMELNERGELLLISQTQKFTDFPFMPTQITRPSMSSWDYFIPALSHLVSIGHECILVSSEDFHTTHKVQRMEVQCEGGGLRFWEFGPDGAVPDKGLPQKLEGFSPEQLALVFGDDARNGRQVMGTMHGSGWLRVRERGALDKLLPVTIGGARMMKAVPCSSAYNEHMDEVVLAADVREWLRTRTHRIIFVGGTFVDIGVPSSLTN